MEDKRWEGPFELVEKKDGRIAIVGEFATKKKARKAMLSRMREAMEKDCRYGEEQIADAMDKMLGFSPAKPGDRFGATKRKGWIDSPVAGSLRWKIARKGAQYAADKSVSKDDVRAAADDLARRMGIFASDEYVKIKTLTDEDLQEIARKLSGDCSQKKLDNAIWRRIEKIDGKLLAKAIRKAYGKYVDGWLSARLDAGMALALGTEFEMRGPLYSDMAFWEYIVARACDGEKPMTVKEFVDSGAAAKALSRSDDNP